MSELVKLIIHAGRRHGTWKVFTDFLEMSAITISNVVDLNQFDKREERYMQIVRQYEADEIKRFPEMMAMLVNSLDDGFADVLGRTFHDLELHNKYVGQFFTPFDVCRLMSSMTVDDERLSQRIDSNGFVTLCEPAAGSGAMAIAFAERMKNARHNPQRHLHVTAVDVDLKCVHMAYLQLSLYHIPAVVVHGNSLSLEEYSHWYTPAHVLGFWSNRLRSREPEGQTETETPIQRVAAAAVGGQLSLF